LIASDAVQHTDFMRALERREILYEDLRVALRPEKVGVISLPTGRVVAFDPTYRSA